MSLPDPRRGELWWLDWSPGRGSEQAGRRPALVIQTDAANSNRRYPNTIVAAVSTRGRDLPFHVPLAVTPESGLSAPSWAKCEQVMTISKERLEEKLGAVSAAELEAVGQALRIVLEH